MAIVNLTPDSFSGDGLQTHGLAAASAKFAVAAAIEAIDSGADILDLGAESTRPGAEPLSTEAEQARLLPVLEGLMNARPKAVVSVDTYHAATARAAVRLGAEIVNDPSCLTFEPQLARTVAQFDAGLVLNHMRGTPETWAKLGPIADPIGTIARDLEATISRARHLGVEKVRIVIDPGLGFGKRKEDNSTILARLGQLN